MEPCYPQLNLPTRGQREVGWMGAHHSPWFLKEQRESRGGDRAESSGRLSACSYVFSVISRNGSDQLKDTGTFTPITPSDVFLVPHLSHHDFFS